MFDVNIKIIAELKSFLNSCISDPKVMDHCRKSSSDFTRNRKLSFERLVFFIAKLCKKTLSVDLDNFFENELNLPAEACSVSAFSQQRSKLDSLFFQLWNEVLFKSFYSYGKEHTKRWSGYKIIAVDGTAVSLISTEKLSKYFGGQRNPMGAFTGAKALLHYDVLNKLFIHAHFATYRTGELNMAYPAIERLPTDSIAIYDRNFCNYKMVALHSWTEQERRFVIRGRESQNFIKKFLQTGLRSQEVYMLPGPSPVKELRKSGFIVSPNTKLKVRLVRVELNNGKTEVLLTNLWEHEGFDNELFKDLYFMRWNIETGISVLKNLLELESFSGLTVESVKQDFYATIFTSNLGSLIIRQAEEMPASQKQDGPSKALGRPKTLKRPMQINRNKATAKFRQKIVGIFIAKRPDEILIDLSKYFRKHMLPVRKGRSFQRRRQNRQSFSKHKTYSNYKKAA